MEPTYWHRQGSEPLFSDLLWSKPENRRHAGKLLIIGGNQHGFAAPANAYAQAMAAGIGSARVLLPSALQKTVGKILEHGEFAPSTPSGSFSKQALAEWLDHAAWADAVLLAGDLGRNSETAIAIEQFTTQYAGQLIITKDAADYFYNLTSNILKRPQTTFVISMAQLQKLARHITWPHAVTFDMGLAQLVEWLHDFSAAHPTSFVVYHNSIIFAAHNGQVSTTKVGEQQSWRVTTAAHCAVWLCQNPSIPFEALTTAVFEVKK
jgi:hypothetical protein